MRLRENAMQDSHPTNFRNAIRDWESILGKANVMNESMTLRPTYAVERAVHAILKPSTVEEVAAVVRVAHDNRLQLYPFSAGCNWGFGSRLPVRDNAVLVDLSRLSRILEYDEELAYVRVEPGVTQQHLYDFLEKNGSRLCMDPTGAGPRGSIIGNALERGHGLTPYGDHVRFLSDLTVVLATGETIHTGYSRFPGCRTRNLDCWGIGSSLDGLFSQSNLGIVVEATVQLMPRPECVALASIGLDSADLVLAVDRLRELQLSGTLRGVPCLFNDVQVIQSQQQHPRRGTISDFQRRREELRRDAATSPWTASVGLYGTKREVDTQAAILASVFEDRRVAVRDVRATEDWPNEHQKFLGDLIAGKVTGGPKRAYCRKSQLPPDDPDPDRDACGVLWLTPAVPMTGHHVDRVASLCESVIEQWGYEPAIAVFCKRPRLAHFHVSIMFDLEELEEHDGRALRCQEALRRELLDLGYVPHRLGIHEMDTSFPSEQTYVETLSRIKAALDPAGILSPGRYELGGER